MSLCPGTRVGANVLGQTPLSRDVPGQNHFPKRTQKTGKGRSKTGKSCSKTRKGRYKTKKDVLKIGNHKKNCPRPVPDFDRLTRPVSSHGKISDCPVVPLSQKVALSRSIGNAKSNLFCQ